MLVFGVDVPLVEVLLVITFIIFILLVEAVVVIALLMKNLNRNKKIIEVQQKLSETLLEIKNKEIEVLNYLKR